MRVFEEISIKHPNSVGRIQVSASTHSLLASMPPVHGTSSSPSPSAHSQATQNVDDWQPTGGIEVKGKGIMETYMYVLPPGFYECPVNPAAFAPSHPYSTNGTHSMDLGSNQILPGYNPQRSFVRLPSLIPISGASGPVSSTLAGISVQCAPESRGRRPLSRAVTADLDAYGSVPCGR